MEFLFFSLLEIDTIFVGGTDTTSTTLTSTLIMLAIYPEIQDKVVAELHEVFDDADSLVTYEDLSKLTYLEMVVKESLRHFPVGPFIARKTSDDFPFKGKFDILVTNFENILCEQKKYCPFS